MNTNECEAVIENKIATQCCSCKRVRVERQWVHQPELWPSGLLYSHGYCPDCYSQALEAAMLSMSPAQ